MIPNSYNVNDIEWNYSDSNGTRKYNYGEVNISRSIWERDEVHNTSVQAGYPDVLEKSIDVKWFDRHYSKTAMTIGSSSNSIMKKALELTNLTKRYAEKLEKIPFIKRVNKNENTNSGISLYFDVIPFERTLENIEDKNSRLYYSRKTTKGGLELGLSGTTKWTLFGIPYEKIPGPSWVKNKAREYLVAEVYVSATARAGGELKVKRVEHKFAESNTWREISSRVDPALIKLDIALGVGAEVSLFKGNSNKITQDNDKFEWFTLHASAEGMANAELLSIGWVKGRDFDLYFLREGVWINVTTNIYAIVVGKKFEMEPYNEKITIIDPIK